MLTLLVINILVIIAYRCNSNGVDGVEMDEDGVEVDEDKIEEDEEEEMNETIL